MKRPPMRLHGAIVLPLNMIKELQDIKASVPQNDHDVQMFRFRFRNIMCHAVTPTWSFMYTTEEWLGTTPSGRIKCKGMFRCRQTHEIVEKSFLQDENQLVLHRSA